MGEVIYHSESPALVGKYGPVPPRHHFTTDRSTGYKVCIHCGLVLEEPIFEYSLPYSQKAAPSSTHQASQRHSLQSHPRLRRAFKLDRIATWERKKQQQGAAEISRLVAIHGLGKNALGRAQFLFKKMAAHPNFEGHYIHLMAQVALYYAAREMGAPVVLEDLLADSSHSRSLAQRYFFTLLRTFGLRQPISHVESFIAAYGTRLRIAPEFIQRAVNVFHKFQECKNTSGCDSRGLAAGALYYACMIDHIRLNQKLLAHQAGISEITIRSRVKEMLRYRIEG